MILVFCTTLTLGTVNCGGGGSAPAGGNDVSDEEGLVMVEMTSVQTGVEFSVVETEDFIATVYSGEQVYDDSNQGFDFFDLNFAVGLEPPVNFLHYNDE